MAENNAPPVTYTMDDMNDMTDTQFLDMILQKLDKVLVEHGLTPTEVQKLRPKCSVSTSGETTAMCQICECTMGSATRTMSRHITSAKHRENLADRLGIDVDELCLFRIECQYCKQKLSILRKDALKRHENNCRVKPLKPRMRRKKDKTPKPKRLSKKERAALSRAQRELPAGSIKLEPTGQYMNYLWTIPELPDIPASSAFNSRATALDVPSGGFGTPSEIPTIPVKLEPSDQVMNHLWAFSQLPGNPASSASSAPSSRAATPLGSLGIPSDDFDYSSRWSSPLTELSPSPEPSRAPTPYYTEETSDPSSPISDMLSIIIARSSPTPSLASSSRAPTPFDPPYTGESSTIILGTSCSSERLLAVPSSVSRATTPSEPPHPAESPLSTLGTSFSFDRRLPIPYRLQSASPSPTSSSRAPTPYELFSAGQSPPDLKDPGPSSKRLPSIATFDSETLERFMWNRSSLEILRTLSAQDDSD